jgi:hypothetical protein
MLPALRDWHDRRHALTEKRVLEAVRAEQGHATAHSIAVATSYGITRTHLALARLEEKGKIHVSWEGSSAKRPSKRLYIAVARFPNTNGQF